MAPTDFIVIAETRSSSTNLIRWLAQLPASLVFADPKEIIHPHWLGLSVPYSERLRPVHPQLDAWRQQRLREFYGTDGAAYRFRGSKVTAEMSFPGFRGYLESAGFKIIALTRHDYIGQVLSMYYSQSARLWHRWDESTAAPRIRYRAADSSLRDAVQHLKNQRLLLSLLTEGLEHLRISREEALESAGKQKILDFLGASGLTAETPDVELPLAPYGYRLLIENYDELLGDIAVLWLEVQEDERASYY